MIGTLKNGLFTSSKRRLSWKSSQQLDSIPLPNIFKHFETVKPNVKLPAQVVAFPWLCSTDPPRKPMPSLWSTLRDRHFLTLGIERAQKHLQKPAYNFPYQFNDDAALVVQDLFWALNHASLNTPSKKEEAESVSSEPIESLIVSNNQTHLAHASPSDPIPTLDSVMVRSLADIYSSAIHSIPSDYSLSFESPNLTGKGISIHPKWIHFTYGPYPVPPTHALQKWWSFMTLAIPKAKTEFESYPDQKRLTKEAMDEGVYMKIYCQVKFNDGIEFVVRDKNTGDILKSDRRKYVDVQFVSPHFTPWDEIFELMPDGDWKLRWKWRVSDIDYLLAQTQI